MPAMDLQNTPQQTSVDAREDQRVETQALAHKIGIVANQLTNSSFVSERRARAFEHLREAMQEFNREVLDLS